MVGGGGTTIENPSWTKYATEREAFAAQFVHSFGDVMTPFAAMTQWDGAWPVFHFDASDVASSDGDVVTAMADKFGAPIALTGSLSGSAPAWSAATTYNTSAHGKPCIRLQTSVTKDASVAAYKPSEYARFLGQCGGIALDKTVFIVGAGQATYAYGYDPEFEQQTSREYSTVALSGQLGVPNVLESEAEVPGVDVSNLYLARVRMGEQHVETTLPEGIYIESSEPSVGSYLTRLDSVRCFGATPTVVCLNLGLATGDLRAWINGELHTIPAAVAGYAPVYAPARLFSVATEVFYFPGDDLGVVYSCRFDLFEVIIFDSLLADAKRLEIEAALIAKWGTS